MKYVMISAIYFLAMTTVCLAADDEAAKPEKAAATQITVAILDFHSSDPANKNLGEEVAAALTAMLSGQADFKLVDRQSLDKTLQEYELNLTGLVSDDQAIKVGKLVGAKIMVTGRAFRLGKDLFITAKLIGTETSLIEGAMVKGKASDDIGTMVVKLSDILSKKISQSGPKLIAAPDAVDPLIKLKERLTGKKLPVIAVIVKEEHHAAPTPEYRQPIDPAVETEIKKILIQAGFTVKDVPQNELTDFAKNWTAKDIDSWPRGMENVEVLVAGEAFSEYAARIGNIVSCSARAEINMVNRDTGKIDLAERTTTRAADLSENIAGKKALQSAGRKIAIRIIEHFADALETPKQPAVATPQQ